MAESIAVGATFLLDGKAWTIAAVSGNKASAQRFAPDEKLHTVSFDAREVVSMGPGIFGLPGRIEAPKVDPDATAVAGVAVAALKG